jgi:hypothetical protein
MGGGTEGRSRDRCRLFHPTADPRMMDGIENLVHDSENTAVGTFNPLASCYTLPSSWFEAKLKELSRQR